jgi:hypothetical protein
MTGISIMVRPTKGRRFLGPALILAALLGTGCASTETSLRDGPWGIVSVVSNSDINWSGEEPDTDGDLMGKIMERRLKESNRVTISKADGLIDRAEDILRDILSREGQANLAEKERIITAGAYGKAELNPHQEAMVKAQGYRFVYYRDKTFPVELARETGIRGSVFITFDFTKNMTSGLGKTGSCQAEAAMTVIIIDAQGKTVYHRTHQGWSDNKIKVTAGAYTEEELMALFPEAIRYACLDFINDNGRK